MSVVVMHDLGDALGGAGWRSVAPSDWIVPDLPGHGETQGPRSGHYDPMAVATIARWEVANVDGSLTVLVGVGENAHAALVCAAGAVSDAVVIVDGLWGPWESPVTQINTMYATLRAIADDSAAVSAPPASVTDPRTKYGYGMTVSDAFVQQFWGSIGQPVLAIETPRSKTPGAERAARVGYFGGPASIVEVDDDEPATLVRVIVEWQSSLLER